MTTSPLTRSGAASAAEAPPPTAAARLRRAVAAERLTVLATPAARVLLGASVVMAVGSCWANLAAAPELTPATREATVELAMHASTVATLVFALVAGLYSATSDQRFGLIDQRVLSEGRRGVVLAGKATVLAGLGLVYGAAGAATAAIAGSAWFAADGERLDLTSEPVVRALAGVVLASPLMALLGVAVGTLLRSQPLAIGGSLTWLLVAEPTLLLGVPDIGRLLPGSLAVALTASPDPALLSQAPAGALLVGYVVLASLLARAVLRRRDLSA